MYGTVDRQNCPIRGEEHPNLIHEWERDLPPPPLNVNVNVRTRITKRKCTERILDMLYNFLVPQLVLFDLTVHQQDGAPPQVQQIFTII